MATLVFGHIVIQYLFSNVKGTARCKAICTTTCGLILTPIVQIHLESVSTVIFGIVFNWISTEEEKTTNHFFLKDYDQFKEQDDAYHRDKSQQIPVVSSYSISVSSSACFLSSTLFPLFSLKTISYWSYPKFRFFTIFWQHRDWQDVVQHSTPQVRFKELPEPIHLCDTQLL